MNCPNCNEELKLGIAHDCAETIKARRGAVGLYRPTEQDKIWIDACEKKKSGERHAEIRSNVNHYYTKLNLDLEDKLSMEKRQSKRLSLLLLVSIVLNIWLSF